MLNWLILKAAWGECKAYTVKRAHVTKLVESVRNVKELNEENDDVQKWSPNMLMLASNHGFDVMLPNWLTSTKSTALMPEQQLDSLEKGIERILKTRN